MPPQIFDYFIYNATAEIRDNGSLKVVFTYPDDKKVFNTRLTEDLGFGIFTLEKLLNEGKAELATPDFPLKTPSGGALYVTTDDMIVCHRRDIRAPTHKMCHSAEGGFASGPDDVLSAEGLERLALREKAEETLLFKRLNGKLLASEDYIKGTIHAANVFGVYPEHEVFSPSYIPGRDLFEARSESGELLFSMNTFFGVVYESARSCNIYLLMRIPFSSKDITPLDAQGMISDGTFIHYDREAYFIPLSEVDNKSFGTPLEKFEVFKAHIMDGVPDFYIPEPKKPYWGPFDGPGKLEVSHPQLWAPEDMLVGLLDASGVNMRFSLTPEEAEKYKGIPMNKLGIELIKCLRKQAGKQIFVPDEYIVGVRS